MPFTNKMCFKLSRFGNSLGIYHCIYVEVGSNKYVNRKLNHCGTLTEFIDTCHSIVIYTGLVYNKNNICQKTKQEYAFKS